MEAEQAERARREVVSRARPVVKAAEEREKEALELRRDAADTQFHAQASSTDSSSSFVFSI